MNIFTHNEHLKNDKITYEYCSMEYKNISKKSNISPFFISGWDVNVNVETPVFILNQILNKIEKNINTYYLTEEDIGKTEVLQYLSRLGVVVDINQVLIANSASALLCYAITSLSIEYSNVLVLNPTYYSIYDSLELIKCSFESLNTLPGESSYDYDRIESIIHSKNIHTLILTDPLFGSGIPICKTDLKRLVDLSNKHKCRLIVDMARYGLIWDDYDEPILGENLEIIQNANEYIVVYSPCKKVFANGIKTGILISSRELMSKLSQYSDSVLGSVSASQIEFLKVLLSSNSYNYFREQRYKNICQIKKCFEIVLSSTLNSPIKVFCPQMGHYALASIPLNGKNYRQVFSMLLNEANIYTLPMNLYGLSDKTNYYFRINLLADVDRLVQSLWKIISILGKN